MISEEGATVLVPRAGQRFRPLGLRAVIGRRIAYSSEEVANMGEPNG